MCGTTCRSREDAPPDPLSPYGVTKLAAERFCVAFARVYEGLEATVLRFFNVFGPRQSPHSQYAAVVPKFMTRIAAGQPITIDGDGEQSRDFTYIGNVVDATIRAAYAEGVSGRIFNVASSRSASVNHLAETIGSILDRPVHKEHAPPRAGDIRDSWATSLRPARPSAGSRPSGSKKACGSPPLRCSAEQA